MTRAPQQDRSRATRLRLLEAAVDCLAERGWAQSSVAAVAERGRSVPGRRAAPLPDPEDLFAAAFAHMAQVRLDRVRAAAATLPEEDERTHAVLVMLCGIYTGPLFRAALHLHTAAAAGGPMAGMVAESEARVNAEVHRVATELLNVDESVPGHRELVQGSLDLIRGLALADVLTDDSVRRARVLRRWARVLDDALTRAPVGLT